MTCWRVWHWGRIITQAEHDYRLTLKAWALANDPSHPAANPRKPINLAAMPPLYQRKKKS